MRTEIDLSILSEMVMNTGDDLKSLVDTQPVMLVFLRHFGCVFCKEALSDLAEKRSDFESRGAKIVFVHMSENDVAYPYFKRYGLDGIHHVSDPSARFYRAFGLVKGSFKQLYGLSTWMKGYAARQQGHELEIIKQLGDSTQMPGIFILHENEIKEHYIHKLASDRPNYDNMMACCIPAA